MVYCGVIFHIEIEFRDADGNLQSRVFPRATSHSFEVATGLEIRSGMVNRFMIRDYSQVTRFEASTLRDRMTDEEFDDLRADIGELCANKKRIPAIKLVREKLGYDLKGAKDYIDADWPREKVERDFDDIPF